MSKPMHALPDHQLICGICVDAAASPRRHRGAAGHCQCQCPDLLPESMPEIRQERRKTCDHKSLPGLLLMSRQIRAGIRRQLPESTACSGVMEVIPAAGSPEDARL